MGDLILQTEPVEFQYSKQTTKMAFLHQEIRQLQEYIHDLENVVKLNKEALKIAVSPADNSPHTKSKSRYGHNDTISTGAFTNEASTVAEKANIANLQQVIEHLNQENTLLLTTAQRLRKEREMAESRALISEQICEEAQRHENEVFMELEEKIYELKKLVQDKEYTIQELEKIKPIPDGADVAIKYREVISPSEQSLRLHEEIDALNKMLAKLSKELNKTQAEKQELASNNMNLMNEIRKLEAALALPAAGRLSVRKITSSHTNMSFDGNTGGGGYAGEGDNEGDQSDIFYTLPEKVTKKPPAPKKGLVPALNLGPAKKFQEMIVNKEKEKGLNMNNFKPAVPTYGNPLMQEKLLTLQRELDNTKKILAREIINNNLLNEEISKLQRQTTTLSAQNETLIKSNKRYAEKAQKMHYQLEFYREYYEKYMEMVTKRHQPTKSLSSQADVAKLLSMKKTSENFISGLNAPIPITNKHAKPLISVAEETDHQVNISILEEEGNEHKNAQVALPLHKKNTQSRPANEPDEEDKESPRHKMTKEECKIYLLNLAKDLYLNANLAKSAFTRQILMSMDPRGTNAPAKQVVKLARSLSNPLDYISPNKQKNKINAHDLKSAAKKRAQQHKKVEECSPIHRAPLDLNISAIGKPPEKIENPTRQSVDKVLNEEDISFLAFGGDDGKGPKHQEISFMSNDGMF